ncbi:MAG: DUF4921 family protein [Candidatus Altiarchaeales archaeon]|nr:DUF4921 family protein [Candidatus Altiarchaeales archaeon]MBD3417229.1 DUF4921 family protein [Candidatus Altiarchaeales archaeon]
MPVITFSPMENELRKDYFLDRRVIIAVGRGKRPSDFKRDPAPEEDGKTCFFCPGNEEMTPAEISRVEEDGHWVIRVFPNKYPAVTTEEEEGSDELMPAYGYHEIVVENPAHSKSVSDLSIERISHVLSVYNERVEHMLSDPRVRYALVFKNHGRKAGASLSHTHTQIISTPVVPRLVKEEAEAVERYKTLNGSCPLCDAWKKEVGGPRKVWEDYHMAVFTPYASRSPMEAWIVPKRHVHDLGDLSDEERHSMASAFKLLLEKLRDGLNDPPYNLYFHVNPRGADLHLHVELLPRLSNWAGFELGSEIIINTMAPEDAAEFYRPE